MKLLLLISLMMILFSRAFAGLSDGSSKEYFNLFRDARVESKSETLQANSILNIWGAGAQKNADLEIYSPEENPSLQSYVDELTLKIFDSQVARIFCSVLSGNPAIISQQLAVSTETAQKISQKCSSIRTDFVGDGKIKPELKRYHFVFNIAKDFVFESWTTYDNQTFIFFDHDLTEAELLQRMLHELAISADNKMMASREALPYLLENESCHIKRGSEKEIDAMIGIAPFPAVKFGYAVVRAMGIEALVLQEVYGKQVYKNLQDGDLVFQASTQSDYKLAVRKILNSMLSYQEYFLPLEYSLIPIGERAKRAPQLILSNKDLNFVLDRFENSSARFVCDGIGELSMSEWMGLADFGRMAAFYSRGPRPPIGGGWGAAYKQLLEKDLSLQKDLGQKDERIQVLRILGIKNTTSKAGSLEKQTPQEINPSKSFKPPGGS